MIKRRGLLGNTSDYIQNGLFIHLDGIDKFADGDTVNWHDLTGNGYNAIASGTKNECNKNNIVIKNNTIIKNTTALNDLLNSNYTYEITAKRVSSQQYGYEVSFHTASGYVNGRHGFSHEASGLGVKYKPNEDWLRINIDLNDFDETEIHTYTITFKDNDITLFCDGLYYGTVKRLSIPTISNFIIVLGSYQDFGLVSYSHLYSFRLYDRVLSNSEIIHNAAVDTKRFKEDTDNA